MVSSNYLSKATVHLKLTILNSFLKHSRKEKIKGENGNISLLEEVFNIANIKLATKWDARIAGHCRPLQAMIKSYLLHYKLGPFKFFM